LRTNYVLIDLENVRPESLEELDREHFKVLVFVGSNQPKIPFDLVAAIQKMGARAKYVPISGNGNNALDFHIAFYIGQIAAREPDAFFHIISKDKGFGPLVEHLKTLNIYCARSDSVNDIPLVRSGKVKTPDERAAIFIEKLRKPGATHPRTLKTLENAIQTLFQKQLTPDELHGIVTSLEKCGFVALESNKVIYTESAG
jgi:PIN domain